MSTTPTVAPCAYGAIHKRRPSDGPPEYCADGTGFATKPNSFAAASKLAMMRATRRMVSLAQTAPTNPWPGYDAVVVAGNRVAVDDAVVNAVRYQVRCLVQSEPQGIPAPIVAAPGEPVRPPARALSWPRHVNMLADCAVCDVQGNKQVLAGTIQMRFPSKMPP